MGLLLKTLLSTGLLAATTFLLVAGIGAGPRCACSGAEAAEGLHPRLSSARFGVLMPLSEQGDVALIHTERVPLIAGATFGWQLKLRDNASVVTLREELELPAAPHLWRHTADTAISSDRRTAITERAVHPREGVLDNGWTFTEGDPPGPYTLRLFLDDELVQTFTFVAEGQGPAPCGG